MNNPKRRRYKKFKTAAYIVSALELLRPPDEITVSEWAEKYRKLSNANSMSGSWRNEVTPYLVGIMDAYCDYEIERIIFVKPTQVGGTETLINMLGWTVTQDPSPSLVVMPTEDMVEYMSEERIQQMIRNSPEVERHYHGGDSRRKSLLFDGMYLSITTANSPSGLASRPIAKLFLDEVDKFGGATKKEADPISLAIERTRTFPNRKIYIDSTPTTRDGHIWRFKEAADVEYHYFVPCPHCEKYIELEFNQIKFPSRETGLNDQDRAEQAVYICQKCGTVIADADKPDMMIAGEWRAVRDNGHKRTVAFWLNTLYSPFQRWSVIAGEWLAAQGDPERLHNFYNSWLAIPWEETRQRTSADVLLQRQTNIPECVLPPWTQLLTAGVDVQPDRYYWCIRAWGEGMTSQLIRKGMFTDVVEKRELERIMNEPYSRADGSTMIVDCAFIDSGYDTLNIYDFCARNSEWAIPCKGSNTELNSGIIRHTIDRTETAAYGMPLYYIDGGKYKDLIAARMQRSNGIGSWMVYKDCDRDYAEQVTAEQAVVERDRRGVERRVWKVKVSHADNHYLDCEVYAFAAADYKGVRTLYPPPSEPQTADNPAVAKAEEHEDQWIKIEGEWL